MQISTTSTELNVNGDRLWASLMSLADIGATPKGGVCRLALTDLDRQGRDLFTSWARDCGCTVRVDAIGNIFARREGRNADLPPVMTGSHIDTQPTGGKFDGNYGVLAGLEVLRTLNDYNLQTEAPIEVVVWTNEEGSRFVPVMMGSGVFTDAFSLDTALDSIDRNNISVRTALKEIGYDGATPCRHFPINSYFEAHIEQGPVLEARQDVIGVVTGALGQRWYNVVVQGTESHAGSTPMELRKDALLAAASLIQEVNAIALVYPPDARGTVGWFDVFPNSRNVIPGKVSFSVDLRAPSDDILTRMDTALKAKCTQVGQDSNMSVSVEEVVYFPPQPFDEEKIAVVENMAGALGLPHSRLVSGAGHDAVYLARVCPSAMIFIPCKDGISHNEIEDATPEHIEAGCNVLLHAMLAQAVLA